MDAWLAWLIASVVAAVGEILTTGFFLAPFAIGAAGALVVALAGGGAAVQVIVFALLTVLCVAMVRPVARRHLTHPPQLRTGTAALVGRPAVVLERIANVEGVGTVRIDGEVWTARAYADDEVIERGTRVEVVEIRGATAMVAE
jgi:membrane protein implicated in regulation of membrane protease activity